MACFPNISQLFLGEYLLWSTSEGSGPSSAGQCPSPELFERLLLIQSGRTSITGSVRECPSVHCFSESQALGPVLLKGAGQPNQYLELTLYQSWADIDS